MEDAGNKKSSNKSSVRKRKSGDNKKKEKKVKRVLTDWEIFWDKLKWKSLRVFRAHWIVISVSVFAVVLLLALYLAIDTLDEQVIPTITDLVTFDFAINDTAIGSVQFGLFGVLCPLTVKNFVMLTTHENGYGYNGSKIHHVIPMHMIMGGDIVFGNGTGGRSALGQPFENENFKVKHDGPGYLGMTSLPDNRNSSRSSQFYVTINAVPRLNRNTVAFGKVVGGMNVIKKIEGIDFDDNMTPYGNVTICDVRHEIV